MLVTSGADGFGIERNGMNVTLPVTVCTILIVWLINWMSVVPHQLLGAVKFVFDSN